METFVVDASVTLTWCFEDEATDWTDALLERLRDGSLIHVPAHWPTEVSNGLLMALRRKRIPLGRSELFWDELSVLPITLEPPLSPDQAKAVFSLGEQYGLTVYAAYLELAKRKSFRLATLDAALLKAALVGGVVVVEQPSVRN